MTTHIIIAIIALLFSALFSGYEMAFLHCNRLKVALDKKEGKKYAFVMDKFFRDEGSLICNKQTFFGHFFVKLFVHSCRRFWGSLVLVYS